MDRKNTLVKNKVFSVYSFKKSKVGQYISIVFLMSSAVFSKKSLLFISYFEKQNMVQYCLTSQPDAIQKALLIIVSV